MVLNSKPVEKETGRPSVSTELVRVSRIDVHYFLSPNGLIDQFMHEFSVYCEGLQEQYLYNQ